MEKTGLSLDRQKLSRKVKIALILAIGCPAIAALAVLIAAGGEAAAGVRRACVLTIIAATALISLIAFKIMYDIALRLFHLLGLMKIVVQEICPESEAGALRGVTTNGRMEGDLDLITKRFRQSLEALRRHAHELEQSNKELRHKDRQKISFLAAVSREFVPALESIQGATREALALQRRDLDAQRRHLHAVLQRSESLGRQARDVLALEEIEAGTFSWSMAVQDPAAVLEAAIKEAEVAARQKGIKILRNVQAPLPQVFGDRAQLALALRHLLDNAVQFSRPGGTVHLLLERPSSSEGWVRLAVADKGCGIPESKLTAIFQKFVKLQPADSETQPGLGLGLALAKRIIELHGGRISARSKQGSGSLFALALPAWKDGHRLRSLLDWKLNQARALSLPVAVILVKLPQRDFSARQMTDLCRGLAPVISHTDVIVPYHKAGHLCAILNLDQKEAAGKVARMLTRLESLRLSGLPPLSRRLLRYGLWTGSGIGADPEHIFSQLESRCLKGKQMSVKEQAPEEAIVEEEE